MFSTEGTQDPMLVSWSDHESQLSNSTGSREPGPAILTGSTESSSRVADLIYFHSLPEQVLEAHYPYGIHPPKNLGPATLYDRCDQYH